MSRNYLKKKIFKHRFCLPKGIGCPMEPIIWKLCSRFRIFQFRVREFQNTSLISIPLDYILLSHRELASWKIAIFWWLNKNFLGLPLPRAPHVLWSASVFGRGNKFRNKAWPHWSCNLPGNIHDINSRTIFNLFHGA